MHGHRNPCHRNPKAIKCTVTEIPRNPISQSGAKAIKCTVTEILVTEIPKSIKCTVTEIEITVTEIRNQLSALSPKSRNHSGRFKVDATLILSQDHDRGMAKIQLGGNR